MSDEQRRDAGNPNTDREYLQHFPPADAVDEFSDGVGTDADDDSDVNAEDPASEVAGASRTGEPDTADREPTSAVADAAEAGIGGALADDAEVADAQQNTPAGHEGADSGAVEAVGVDEDTAVEDAPSDEGDQNDIAGVGPRPPHDS